MHAATATVQPLILVRPGKSPRSLAVAGGACVAAAWLSLGPALVSHDHHGERLDQHSVVGALPAPDHATAMPEPYALDSATPKLLMTASGLPLPSRNVRASRDEQGGWSLSPLPAEGFRYYR
jgi:hypothetical protein